jgi:hypothetical protein
MANDSLFALLAVAAALGLSACSKSDTGSNGSGAPTGGVTQLNWDQGSWNQSNWQ